MTVNLTAQWRLIRTLDPLFRRAAAPHERGGGEGELAVGGQAQGLNQGLNLGEVGGGGGTVAGLGLMGAMILVPARWLRRAAPFAFGFALLGLVAVHVPGVGIAANGAARWIAIGSFSLPS